MTRDDTQQAGAPYSGPERRGRRRTWLGVAGVLALLLPAAVAFVWFVALPSRQGTRSALALLNASLARHSDLRLVVGHVGPLGTGLRLTEARLLHARGEATDTLLAARRIHLDVDWVALLLRRPHTYRAHVEGARIRLTVDEAGRLVLPQWRAAKDAADTLGGSTGGVVVRLHDASFELASQKGAVTWWRGGRLGLEGVWVPGGSEWELSEWSGAVPPLGLQLQEGRARATAAGGVFEVEPILLRTDAGSIEGRAEFRGDAVRAELSAREWPWEFFGEILDQPALAVPGEVQVRSLIEGPIAAPRVELAIQGTWRDEDFFMRLAGRASQEELLLDRAELDWSGTRVTGQGRYRADGHWHLAARVVDLDLSDAGRLVPAIRLPPSRLAGPVRIEGEPGRMRVVHESLSGEVERVPLSGLAGEWMLSGRTASWQIAGGVAGGTVRADGEWDGSRLGLRGEATGFDFAEVAQLHPSLDGFRAGEGDGRMTLEGSPDSLGVRFTVEGRGVVWRGLAGDRVTVEGGGRLGRAATRLAGDLAVERLAAGGAVVDSVHTSVRVGARALELASFAAWRGDTTLVAAAHFAFDDAGWTAVAPSLRLATPSAELVATEPVTVRSEGGALEVRSAQLAGTLGRLTLAGFWRPEGASDLRLSVQGLDLALLLPPSESFPVRGRVRLAATLAGPEEALAVRASATADTLWLSGRPVTGVQLELAARREGRRFLLEPSTVTTELGRLAASGSASLTLPEDRAVSWRQALDLRHWQGELSWQDLDLSLPAGWLKAAPDAGGTSHGRLLLRGSPGQQSAECNGSVTGLRLAAAHLDAVRWRLVAAGGRLRVEELEAELGGQMARLSGDAPFVIAWSRSGRDWLPDEPLHLALHLPQGSMRFLPIFVPVVASAEGKLAADVRIEGTARAPLLSGQLTVEDGTVRPSQREEVYQGVRLVVRFEGQRARIERLEARQGEKGRLTGTGEATLFGEQAGEYGIDITATRAVARASGAYAVQFSGTVHLEDGARKLGGLLPAPHITGTLRAESGVILYDFTDSENVVYLTGPRQAPVYTYDVRIVADGRVFWRTPSTNVELKADLSVSRSLEGHKIWGTVESVRGTFFFLENKFEMQRGLLTFDQASSLDAKLDAEAMATVTRALPDGRYDKEEVHLALTGRLREPEVRLWSSGGLSERDIFALLTFGRFGFGDQALLTDSDRRVLVGVTGTQYLMRQLAREFPEIGSILTSVEVGTTAPTGNGTGTERLYTTVGVNSYLTPELRLGYSQVLGGRGEVVQGELKLWGVSAEYRIGRLLFLTGEVVERRVGSSLGSGTFQNQVEYNLDVRARLDY